MMEHDYTAAIEENPMVSGGTKAISGTSACDYLDKHWSTILHALRLAQKVSEPSEEMIIEGGGEAGIYTEEAELCFKAMIAQAEKEIER